MKRARLTKAARAAMWQAQDGKCAICGEPMRDGQRIDEEHSIPIALGGPAKPDRLVHAEPCHRAKTSGTRATSAGSDVHAIAKVKRIKKKLARPISAHNGRVIQSRPFKREPYESPWPKAAERQE